MRSHHLKLSVTSPLLLEYRLSIPPSLHNSIWLIYIYDTEFACLHYTLTNAKRARKTSIPALSTHSERPCFYFENLHLRYWPDVSGADGPVEPPLWAPRQITQQPVWRNSFNTLVMINDTPVNCQWHLHLLCPPSNWFIFFNLSIKFFLLSKFYRSVSSWSQTTGLTLAGKTGGRKTGSVHSRHFPPVTQWETVSGLRPGECTCRSTWISSTQTVHRGCDSSSSSNNMGGKIHPFSYSAHLLFRVNKILFIFYGLYYYYYFRRCERKSLEYSAVVLLMGLRVDVTVIR